MGRFLGRMLVFLVCLVILVEAVSYVIVAAELQRYLLPGSEIYIAIAKSHQKKKPKKVLIGDSVGNQMFPNTEDNDSLVSLACNQAIGVVGQYLLLNNYLNAGNKVDTVFMIYSPNSFKTNLDQIYTFHYFIKPFNKQEYSVHFTETVKEQIKKVPYYYTAQLPHNLATTWAPEFESKDSIDFTFLSPISVEYLTKIKSLSEKHNCKVIILPPPTALHKKPIIDKMDRSEITRNGFEGMFQNYFERIIFLDDALFYDGIHFQDPAPYTALYAKEYLKITRDVPVNTGDAVSARLVKSADAVAQ
jgi:hypothetical protein